MSTDDSSSNNSSKPESEAPSMPSMTMPDISMDSFKAGVHSAVKTCVQGCNSALGSLQHTTEAIRRPVTTGMEHLEMTGETISTEARVAWERRHEFGPYYVGGATIGVFGITALRRGKWPGLVLGGLAGAATYMTIYEPLLDSPSFRLPDMPTMDEVKSKMPNSMQEVKDMLPGGGSKKEE